MQSVLGTAALERAMGVCDPALGAHAARVSANAGTVGVRLGWDEGRLDALRLGAVLHDVGKVNVRPEVLAKPGQLDDVERAEIRAHPIEGLWLLLGVRAFEPALPYVLFHHERWDGHGYPTGRSGSSIPLEGRILAVADAFDAMTSSRPYRRALSAPDAADEIRRCSGTQFDPEIAEAFLEALDAGEITWGPPAVAA